MVVTRHPFLECGRKSNAVCVEAEPMQELIDFVIQAARDGARAE